MKDSTCKYCKKYSLNTLPTRTNCSPLYDRFTCIIADVGNGGKEIIVGVAGKTYGIALNYCPVCGSKIAGNEKFIEEFNNDLFYAPPIF